MAFTIRLITMQFIEPILWDDAIDKLGDRTPIGSLLDSEDWSDVPLALRERAFFSSEVESIRFLQRARDFLTDFQSRTLETMPDGRTALKAGGRQQFVKEMSEFAISEGMGPLDPADAGTIKDIRSEGRLHLIFDTMTQASEDYAYWKQGMNPDVLDAFPAQRFIREHDVLTPRPVHQMNEGVVRLKSDLDFWMAMNDPSFGGFGVPWGPWGFNSGMGVEDVDRKESEEMGLLDAGEKVQPVEKAFNEKLEASTRGLDPDMVSKLKGDFGDQVEFAGDSVKWAGADQEEEKPTSPQLSPPAAGEEGATTPAVVQSAPATLQDILAALKLDGSGKATADDMAALREELKESNPADAEKLIKYIKGAQPAGVLADASIVGAVQEFVDFVPAETLKWLPKLELKVVADRAFLGEYAMGGGLKLSRANLQADPERLRRTMFHELMHWLHRQGPQAYRKLIADHFADRTAADKIKQLAGYAADVIGKKDKWYDSYAGRVYPFEFSAEGLEVPTRYIEWLTFTPQEMAVFWNDPNFRETMKLVLKGLF